MARTDIEVDAGVLAEYALPRSRSSTSKYERGTVLVVGMSPETVGATLLGGNAALRAGAGKLQLMADVSVAPTLAVAVPEARVVTDCDEELFTRADAILVGPGTLDAAHGADVAAIAARHAGPDAALVLDAGALAVFERDIKMPARTVAIPNAVEAARVLHVDPDEVATRPRDALDALVDRLGVCVAMRDAVTYIGTPNGDRFVDRSGDPALATSGSGDVLAGMLAGFAATGADVVAAALWAVHAHGRAGERLAREMRGRGLLARDLVDVIALVVNDLVASAQAVERER